MEAMRQCMLIQELAEKCIVEKMVSKLADSSDIRLGFLKDLAQDIYVSLLEQQQRIESMSTDEQLLYIQRMVFNNLKSKTSRYYYNYKRHEEKKRPYQYDGPDAECNTE